MTKYLFDANIISYFVSGRYPELSEKILQVPPESRFINWIVEQELLYGVYKKNRLDLEIQYHKFFEVCNIIHSNQDIVFVCAKLETRLESKGLLIGPEDLWIASTCLVNDQILVTRDTKHFANISELKVEDWIAS